MSRYYTLVVVPSDHPERACEAAAELLYPLMHNPDEPTKAHNFDYMYSPEDIADLTDDITDHMWPVSKILAPEILAGLGVEAIVTPEGTWHEPMLNRPTTVLDRRIDKARQVLGEHSGRLALRHVLHT